jgi:hypothetical protein
VRRSRASPWTTTKAGSTATPGGKDIATATVTSAVYVDYLQLARTREGWNIANVLWDRVP